MWAPVMRVTEHVTISYCDILEGLLWIWLLQNNQPMVNTKPKLGHLVGTELNTGALLSDKFNI